MINSPECKSPRLPGSLSADHSAVDTCSSSSTPSSATPSSASPKQPASRKAFWMKGSEAAIDLEAGTRAPTQQSPNTAAAPISPATAGGSKKMLWMKAIAAGKAGGGEAQQAAPPQQAAPGAVPSNMAAGAGANATNTNALEAGDYLNDKRKSEERHQAEEDARQQAEEEEEQNESRFGIGAIFGVLLTVLSFVAEDGVIQLIMAFFFGIWTAAKWIGNVLSTLILGSEWEYEFPAPPPPPAPPDLSTKMSDAMYVYATDHPLLYLGINFGVTFAAGYIFLIIPDVIEWYKKKTRKPSAYDQLKDDDEDGEVLSPAEEEKKLEVKLLATTERIESLEMYARIHKGNNPLEDQKRKLELEKQQAKLAYLKKKQMETVGKQVTQSTQSKQPAASGPPSLFKQIMQSTFVKIVIRAANGTLTVGLYFMDVISDVQVILMLFDTRHMIFAWISATLLFAQFFVVYIRVMPYFQSTHGETSTIYRMYRLFGFPFGLIAMDFLMLLEPYGLLAVLTFPDWIKV